MYFLETVLVVSEVCAKLEKVKEQDKMTDVSKHKNFFINVNLLFIRLLIWELQYTLLFL